MTAPPTQSDLKLHKPSFGSNLKKYGLEFIIPFGIVTFFYFTLSLALSISSEYVNLQGLIQLEELFTKLNSLVAIFKLSPMTVFAVLFGLFFLGLLRLPADKSKKLFKAFNKYQAAVRRIYIFVVLLCSFTFFGTQVGDPANDLRLRIKTVREGYAEVREQAREALAEQVATDLYKKIQESFPPSYLDAHALPEKIERQADSLRIYYDAAKTRHEVRVKAVELILATTETARRTLAQPIEETKTVSVEKPPPSGSVAEPDPQKVSYKKIKEAKAAIERHRTRLRTEAIELLRIEGAKKVASQIPKIFIREIKSRLMGQIVEVYPVLGPVFDVFTRTVDKEVETRIEEAIDRVTSAALESPGDSENTIKNEAMKIVSEKKVKIPKASIEKANKAVKRLEQQLASVAKGYSQIDQEVKNQELRKIKTLISQLRHSDEEVRTRAVERLAEEGERLSQSEVNEIINIMRHGNERWEKFLYRESHCRWFEHTTAKYYAAECLNKMKSPYVTEAIAQEAVAARDNGKKRVRVTDPGWI